MKYLSILFILIFSLSIAGQTFSSDWQKVPATFQGDDVEKIYKILESTPVLKEKSEFETTADYQKRVNDLSKIDFGNQLSASSLLTFIYKPESLISSDFESKYDADTQTLNVSLSATKVEYLAVNHPNSSGSKIASINGLPAKPVKYIKRDSYEGQTAYGVKRTIERSSLYYYLVGVNNLKDFKEFKQAAYRPALKLSFPVPLAKAKEVKENLSVLYVGNLVAPYHTADSSSLKPTIDKPRDVFIGYLTVAMDVNEIWIYNGISGEILAKIKSAK
jgi:hypothetical protein